ncbi:MAG: hypothetical protein HQ483_10310 [Rhodospirillales bacterium]|nr:hypothetical protein [Rhodospirillales bacterium]
MIKKFVSDALLSVFMDKKARQKLQAARDLKGKTKAAAPPPAASKTGQPAAQKTFADEPIEVMGQDEIAALIRESLDAAEHEITEKKQKHAANPGRQALINQALAIHQSKKHIVDELPKEQREKLLFMAQQALGAQLKGKK